MDLSVEDATAWSEAIFGSVDLVRVAWLLATRIYQRRQRLSGFCNNKEAILCGASSQGRPKTSGSITDETKLGVVRIFLCWH
ncbi:hypothetical protein [Legionella cincinnatiensis]|uniref:Uncharacterized protein n=1 Tax=Legionella cincinnatiensis TaxID=28085 RepID=A0A378IH11_9GAMM|nr:hypothetical protein [Legionella cincinnatiensis]STX34517.1 Uncharacterised protein [Legionella cincinnatiensis]